jgi:hypothetical protein
MMRYMEWSCALYRAVQEHGMSPAEAGALVETIMSDAYQPVPAAWFKLSRLRSAKQETRVKWILGMITRYFFASPFRSPRMRRVTWTTARRANLASSWCVHKPSRMALRIATSDGNSQQRGRIDAKFGYAQPIATAPMAMLTAA